MTKALYSILYNIKGPCARDKEKHKANIRDRERGDQIEFGNEIGEIARIKYYFGAWSAHSVLYILYETQLSRERERGERIGKRARASLCPFDVRSRIYIYTAMVDAKRR